MKVSRYTSLTAIATSLSVDLATARKIRNWITDPQTTNDTTLRKANELLDRQEPWSYGIEAISKEDIWDHYWGDTVAIYVNRGEAYISTVLFDVYQTTYFITSWGDWLEEYLVRHLDRQESSKF
jgi:hypothetical protein